jgi:hypothetical protein
MKYLLFSVVLAVAADACGGGNNVTGPVPCDTYTGGIIGTGALPGTYDLKSVCSGMKPDQPGAGGTVTITGTDFTASIGTTTYSGMYTLSNPDGITVNLTSPLPTQLVGTYRLRNDSLAVSGTVVGQHLSLVGTRVMP